MFSVLKAGILLALIGGAAHSAVAAGTDVITFDALATPPPADGQTDFAAANGGSTTFDGVTFDEFSDEWYVVGNQFSAGENGSDTFLTTNSGNYALINGFGSSLSLSTAKTLLGGYFGQVDYGDGSHGADEIQISALDSDQNVLSTIEAILPGKTPAFVDTSSFASLSGIAYYQFVPISNTGTGNSPQFSMDDLSFGTPAAVPESATSVSFGLLLAFGLGGMVCGARRKNLGRIPSAASKSLL